MKVEYEIQADVAILTLSGEFNSDTTARIAETAAEAREKGARDFVLDLKGVTSVDSVALEAFSSLQHACEEQLGMLRFCGVDETLRKIFEITRLDKRFTVHEDVEEAMASFA